MKNIAFGVETVFKYYLAVSRKSRSYFLAGGNVNETWAHTNLHTTSTVTASKQNISGPSDVRLAIL